jgi:hypothetical protein
MPVVAIAGDLRVTLLAGHGDAGDHRFLPDIEVAEATDQAHAVHLAGLLLKAPDQQHVAISLELVVLAELGAIGKGSGFCGFRRGLARHHSAPETASALALRHRVAD